jgi:uncharacterized protein
MNKIAKWSPQFVVTHSPCTDGDACAYIYVNYELYLAGDKQAKMLGGNYGDNRIDEWVELFRGKDVLMADFSLPADQLKRLQSSVRSLIILDHHFSAQQNLKEFTRSSVNESTGEPYTIFNIHELLEADMDLDAVPQEYKLENRVIAFFDMERSGLGLMKNFVAPNNMMPQVLSAIERGDLGKANQEDLPFISYVRSFPTDLEGISSAMRSSPALVEAEGKVAWRMVCRQADDALKATVRLATLKAPSIEKPFVNIPICNIPFPLASQVANMALSKNPDSPFAVAWVQTANGGVQLSFRSRPDFDCTPVAKAFGGGGHKQASGANCALTMWFDAIG